VTDANRVVIVDRPGPEIPVVLVKQSPLMAIGVRVLRTYLQSVVGFLVVLGVGGGALLPIEQAVGLAPLWSKLLTALQLGAAPALVALLQNSLELLTALDVTQPRLRG